MEKSATANFSAYNRVCNKFLEACDVEGLNPAECLLAIARFMGVIIPVSTTSSANQASQPQPGSSVSKLTKEQVEVVVREARNAKAKRLGTKPSEVNLTSKEKKDAKAAARARIDRGETIVIPVKKGSTPPTIPAQVAVASVVGPGSRVEEVSSDDNQTRPTLQRDPMVGNKPKSGERTTALTKLKACRRQCLQALPEALLDPKILHLVAYSNHLNTLSRQWEEFKRCYSSDKLSNPMSGLPDPWKLNEGGALLNKVKPLLEEQSSSPGTFTLQRDGRSFWDRDRPSEDCPGFLHEPLPTPVIEEFLTYGKAKN
jgi:hypothetical protein